MELDAIIKFIEKYNKTLVKDSNVYMDILKQSRAIIHDTRIVKNVPFDIINAFRKICIETEVFLEQESWKNNYLFNEIKNMYLPLYSSINAYEGELINKYSSYHSTCFVGCGAIPVSLLLFSKAYDACVIGLEVDQDRTKNAINFVDRRFNYKNDFDINKIAIINCAGELFDYAVCKNVILAASISNKHKIDIINKIKDETFTADKLIINRTPIGNGLLVYEGDKLHCHPYLKLLEQNNFDHISIQLFKVKQ
jgi:hypothetical protein